MEFKAKNYYKNEEVARTYDDVRFTSLKGLLTDRLEKFTINRALTALKPDSKILDIPCGTGRLSLYLARKGFRVTGADISPEMVCISQEKAQNSHYRHLLSFEVSDAEKMQFDDDAFDAVVSLRLFGHVPPALRLNMLREFKRICHGHLIVAYYHAGSIQGRIRRKTRTRLDTPWHPVSFNEIKQELETVGLTLIKILPMALGFSETLIVLARCR